MQKQRVSRLAVLAEALETRGSLHLKEAAALLGVSEMTVRRDVASCEGRFTYLGGHIVSAQNEPGSMGYFLDREADSNIDNKREACEQAVSSIENGDTIFIDCGTTMPHLARRIPAGLSLTVVCYAMNVAEIVCKKPNLKVILLGGIYHPSSASFASAEALEMLRKIGINKAFLSAGGVHEKRGVSCSNFHEVPVKQAAIAIALRKIVVVDSSKLGKVKPAFFAGLDDIDTIVTDSGLDEHYHALFAEAGIELHAAPPRCGNIEGDRSLRR